MRIFRGAEPKRVRAGGPAITLAQGLCLTSWLWSTTLAAQATPPAADSGPTPPPTAQDAGVRADAAPVEENPVAASNGLVAPVLLEAREPVYPAQADPSLAPSSVLLRLTIDTEGRVTEAQVLESGGELFDAAASEAALQYRFSPATRNGQPIVARVPARVAFQLPAAASALDANAEVDEPSATPEAELPAEPLPVSASAVPAPVSAPQEVTVRGHQREAERLAQSAEAVTVVDLKRARREASSLGEVLARVPGVSIRRAGGLGATERLSLNGLADDRIAVFLDTVPLEFAFFPFGVSSFPVNLSDRVEIYKGVVPLRFGADALGGAIHIVTDRRYENSVTASLELASFGTQRVTVNGGYHHDPTGFVLNGMGFYDHAENDYEIDVTVPDARGRPVPARVRRFHDAYRAYGGTIEAGIVDKPWAKRLLLRAYTVAMNKELQHNVIMTVPYGEAHYAQTATGLTGRYLVEPSQALKLELIASYSYRTADFVDKSMWVYNWRGERVNTRRVGGEIEGEPTDQVFWWHNALGRAVATYHLLPTHVLTLVTSPTFVKLTGDERIQANPNARDPLTARRDRLTAISGIEYEANLFPMPDTPEEKPASDLSTSESREDQDYRVQNLLFVKHYLYQVWSEETLPGGALRDRNTKSSTFGVGDGFRLRFARPFMLKLSYEYTTRLPRPDEVFGDGMLVIANLDLQPELSHNFNVTPQLDLKRTVIGDLHVEATGVYRQAQRQIVLLGSERAFTWQNVYGARSKGVEAIVDWTAPGKYVLVNWSGTWLDFRNASSQGTFGDFKGDRIPNRPWLFSSWNARFHFERVFANDEIEPFYIGRAVGKYFRGWESQGLRAYKKVIDPQLTHTLGLTYVLHARAGTYTLTFEVDNFTNAKAYDFYGVQRPGRSFAVKLTGDLR